MGWTIFWSKLITTVHRTIFSPEFSELAEFFYFSDLMVDIWCGPFSYFLIVHNPFLNQTAAMDRSITVGNGEVYCTGSSWMNLVHESSYTAKKEIFFVLPLGLEPMYYPMRAKGLTTILQWFHVICWFFLYIYFKTVYFQYSFFFQLNFFWWYFFWKSLYQYSFYEQFYYFFF